jgi:hypothetical protein
LYCTGESMIASLLAASLALADPAQIDCPVTSLTAAQRAAFVAYVAEMGGMQDPRFLVMVEAVGRCQQRFGWSGAAAWRARIYQLAATGEALARRQLAARGVALAPLEQAIAGDAPLTQALAENRVGDGVADFIRRRGGMLDPALLTIAAADRPAAVREVEAFVTYHGMARYYRARFAAE